MWYMPHNGRKKNQLFFQTAIFIDLDISLIATPSGLFTYLGVNVPGFMWGRRNAHFLLEYRNIYIPSKLAIGNLSTTLGWHADKFHHYQDFSLSFLALDSIHQHICGGDSDNVLLKCESQWIFKLKATCWPGLNKTLSFKPLCLNFCAFFALFPHSCLMSFYTPPPFLLCKFLLLLNTPKSFFLHTQICLK